MGRRYWMDLFLMLVMWGSILCCAIVVVAYVGIYILSPKDVAGEIPAQNTATIEALFRAQYILLGMVALSTILRIVRLKKRSK